MRIGKNQSDLAKKKNKLALPWDQQSLARETIKHVNRG